MTEKNINLLFSGTSDYVKYAAVTVMSATENTDKDTCLNVCFLYADIIKPIDENQRNMWFEEVQYSFKDKNVKFEFINAEDKLHLLNGLNIGCWGEKVSRTHYIHYLAQICLPNIDKIIHLDCDMTVNCNLAEIFNTDMQSNLIALASPSGFEKDKTMSNGGFSILNLKQWREENTFSDIISFGQKLPPSEYCDQYLLHEYFKKTHPERLLLVEKEYNLFPQCIPEKSLDEIKILHYAGSNEKPWNDIKCDCRGSFLWWKYAEKTAFYQKFIGESVSKQIFKSEEKMFFVTIDNINACKNAHHRATLYYKTIEKPLKFLKRVFLVTKMTFSDNIC